VTRPVSFDAETSSPVNLTVLGADAYTRDPRTRCLMFAWHAVNDPAPPELWLEGDPVPPGFAAVAASGTPLTGWNVIGFDRQVYDRILVARHGFPPINGDLWKDSMHAAAMANLPRSLDGCAGAVGVAHDKSLKDSNRIRRITDANRTLIPAPVGDILRDPGRFDEKLVDDLQWLAARCRQDVLMEEQVLVRLPPWPGIEPWLSMPAVDRRINDRGVMIDLPLVRGLAQAAAVESARLDGRMAKLTKGEVPRTTNIEALKHWLMARGVELPRTDADEPESEDGGGDDDPPPSRKSPWRLRKSDIADLMSRTDVPEECRLALGFRAEGAKASTAKLKAMLGMADDQWRLKGLFILGGAQQTMRFSSNKPQWHNTVRDVFGNPDEVASANGLDAKKDRAEVKRLSDAAVATAVQVGCTGDADLMRAMYETVKKDAQGREYLSGVTNWISRMTRRTATVPDGFMLLNGDWAQIEARITDWLAQEESMMAAWRANEDVYRVIASGIFNSAQDSISKSQRQSGKVAKLACGFGGGASAMAAMAVNYGILMSKEEAAPFVKGFRASNPATVAYWSATLDAASMAVMNPGREFWVPPLGLVSYFTDGDCLLARLPSGRCLRYWQPRLSQGYWPDGRPKDRLDLSALTVKGRAVFRRSIFWTVLVENQVQAIAADMLCCALKNADDAGLPVCLHVHDNIAAEVHESRAADAMPVFEQCMFRMPSWTAGLPIGVEAEAGTRFG
jgi:DNA polymerase